GWGEAGYATADPKLWDILKVNSRENRQNQTEAESLLWQHLRNNQTGYKIRRQHAVGSYIADFICLKKALIIEVDGDYHQEITEQDELRTQVLNELGFEVIRFTNDEVTADINKVVKAIKNKLDNQPESYLGAATSLSSGEGRGEASYPYELSTMPGWAGSSWYWYRYMDANNNQEFASKEAIDYWKDVDLYIGGSEHATGHLLYSRFWNKFLKDLGLVEVEEPFKKLINQGMILGTSEFIHHHIMTQPRFSGTDEEWQIALNNGDYKYFFSDDVFDPKTIYSGFVVDSHVDISIVNNSILNINAFLIKHPEYKDYKFICEGGFWQYGFFTRNSEGSDKFRTKPEVEKMSKSKFNVVNPDEMIERYGADTLRMYEMFLGPLEQSKPWNTNGIEGVFKFLRKFWKLFHDD
ncbi:MAG: DUF559 domain-containing protein, partial [Sphingobacteriaceae bacterium]